MVDNKSIGTDRTLKFKLRALIIEDDSSTARSLSFLLRADGFVCDAIDLGEEALEIGQLYEYDLVILDLLLPDINGCDVLRRMRSRHIKTPVIVLSGLTDIEDKVKALTFGADDYITKPFAKNEFLARTHAVIRRSRGHSVSHIKTGPLVVDIQSRTATIHGKVVDLTSKEYAILELLSVRKGTTLTKDVFLNHLYGGMDEPDTKIIDVFICKLRRKLTKACGNDHLIETIWGRGYVLREPIDAVEIPQHT